MNIWSLDKQNTIKQLLLRLEERFGKGSFYLVAPQDTNQQSVRISPLDESMTIYIYSYGQSSGHYGLHLEFTSADDATETINEEIYDEIPFALLVDILGLYL
jgi:hypothetical protein